MGVAVIAANTSIKYGSRIRKPASTIVGGNGDTGRVTWVAAPTNGVLDINFDFLAGGGTYHTLIPYVSFTTAGGGSNNRLSETQVWVDNVLVYNGYQTGGVGTGYQIYFPRFGGFSLGSGAKIEYRLNSFKDVGGSTARQITCGYFDSATSQYYNADLVIQEKLNSP